MCLKERSSSKRTMKRFCEVMAGQKNGGGGSCTMPAHGSETGSCIVNKRRELYGKGKECWNAVQGQFSMVLLCTLNVICSLPPNMKMKMFLIFGGGGGDILSCLGIDWLLVSNSLCL